MRKLKTSKGRHFVLSLLLGCPVSILDPFMDSLRDDPPIYRLIEAHESAAVTQTFSLRLLVKPSIEANQAS